MKNLFPTMYSRPKPGMPIALGVYAFVGFLVIPMWLHVMNLAIWEDMTALTWVEIGYHVLNAAVAAGILKECLGDGWFMMTTDWGGQLKHVGLTVGLILGTLVLQIAILFAWGVNPWYCLNALPVVEKYIALTPGYMASVRPVFGTISMVVCAPIAVSGLFYAAVFAPLCVHKKPVLAYILTIVVTMIPAAAEIIWHRDVAMVVILYLVQLPAHLIACWSYQKTDNIWTPILSLAAVNLICSLVNIFVM